MSAVPAGRAGGAARTVARTTPYPWPWDGDLEPAQTAVVVLAPRGGGPRADGPTRAAIGAVCAAARCAGGLVIDVTTRPPGRDALDELAGPSALRTIDPLPAAAADIALRAGGIDGFCDSALEHVLRRNDIRRVILVGAGLETCVHSTMRSANDRGYECLLVIDAAAPYDVDLIASSVSMIEMSGGIFGAVGRAAQVVASLTGDSSPAAHEP